MSCWKAYKTQFQNADWVFMLCLDLTKTPKLQSLHMSDVWNNWYNEHMKEYNHICKQIFP